MVGFRVGSRGSGSAVCVGRGRDDRGRRGLRGRRFLSRNYSTLAPLFALYSLRAVLSVFIHAVGLFWQDEWPIMRTC
jgi:hypothetical protein